MENVVRHTGKKCNNSQKKRRKDWTVCEQANQSCIKSYSCFSIVLLPPSCYNQGVCAIVKVFCNNILFCYIYHQTRLCLKKKVEALPCQLVDGICKEFCYFHQLSPTHTTEVPPSHIPYHKLSVDEHNRSFHTSVTNSNDLAEPK